MDGQGLIQLQLVRDQLLQHEMYQQMNTAERVRIFMKHHVFAVWDFMSLLKRLQQELTCVTYPWVPKSGPSYSRYINEIVLGEETDEDGQGGYISHFELYLSAMKEVGADTRPIEHFVHRIISGEELFKALDSEDIPHTAKEFVKCTLETAMEGEVHEVAASFFFGREEIIPDMFTILVHELEGKNIPAAQLTYYLHRHIELDGDKHGPLAEKLLMYLCEGNEQKLAEAHRMATLSLEKRMRLWDGVLEEIHKLGI